MGEVTVAETPTIADILKIGRNGQLLLSRRIRAEVRGQEGDRLPLEDAIIFRRTVPPTADCGGSAALALSEHACYTYPERMKPIFDWSSDVNV